MLILIFYFPIYNRGPFIPSYLGRPPLVTSILHYIQYLGRLVTSILYYIQYLGRLVTSILHYMQYLGRLVTSILHYIQYQ